MKRPTIGIPKEQKQDAEFEKRCREFIEHAKQHPDLKPYFSQINEDLSVAWKLEPSKSFFDPVMRVLANKQGGKEYVEHFTRLKQQQNQWNNDTLQEVLKSFIKVENDEVRMDCLRQIHKRAYTSAEKLNKALLGDPNQTLDQENYGALLARKFPDVHSTITESQPELPLNLEKSYSVVLLEGFVDALLPELRDKAEAEVKRYDELIKEQTKNADISLLQQRQQALVEVERLDKRIRARGKQAVQEKIVEQSPHKAKFMTNPLLISPPQKESIASTSKVGAFFNKILGQSSKEPQKVESPRVRSPSVFTPSSPLVQPQGKEFEMKMARQRSKSAVTVETKKFTPPSPPI